MKKLSKIALKANGVVLNENEMQKILGGGSYGCYCGHNGEMHIIVADCIEGARQQILQECSDGWC